MQNAWTRLMWTTLDERDAHTGEHCDRVGELCARLARGLGLGREDSRLLRLAGALHDLGKVGIPDDILLKRGTLDRLEWEVMRTHAERGARLIAMAETPGRDRLAQIVLHHHEHFDGSGYPAGLRGSAIPLLARAIAVVDSYDAMTERRAYRDAMPSSRALEIMRRERGTHFDPEVVDLFEVQLAAAASRVPARPSIH